VCAGKGWEGEEVRRMAEEAGVAGRLVTPGFISRDFAVRLLNNANVFVFPSFAEGFGMPNIESMACGCPVVTSNIFAIPEVVGDAAAIVGSPYDYDAIASALARIETDGEYKKALVERGLERCKIYNWDSSAQALLDGWLAVLGA
jgi:glycosyltransferase involved in cell wall biosynthesis